MNLKLDIKQINNEDVIATSGLCQHINANAHIYVNKYDGSDKGKEKYAIYSYDAITGKLSLTGVTEMDVDDLGVTSTGWYYDNGPGYTKCENDAEHPIN